MKSLTATLCALITQEPMRRKALECHRALALPDSYIGAGFVRNLVWDYLHDRATPTPLSDVDVIFFDKRAPVSVEADYEQLLSDSMPECKWEVRNQARMHLKHGHQPYQDTLDAITYWTECETAVAVRLLPSGRMEIIAPFGLTSLFAGQLTPNPKRDHRLFESRLARKNWLSHWPRLTVNHYPTRPLV